MSGPTYQEIPLDQINEPPAPIRQSMSDEGIQSLAASIKEHSQLQPLGVFPDEGRFTISYGHRRYVALSLLGDRPARCLVFESSAEAMLGAQLAENVDREDMGPVDEAYWFAQLLEALQTDTNGLSERLKMTRNYIEGRLELLTGDPLVLEVLRAGAIKLGIARELNTIEDTLTRRMFLDMVRQREATLVTLQRWIAEWRATGNLARREAAEAAGEPSPVSDIAPPPPIECDFCGDAEEPWTMEPTWTHKRCKKVRDNMIERAAAMPR